MKVAILWTDLSGYLNSCFRQLQAAGAELLVFCSKGDPNAPFDTTQFGWIDRLVRWSNEGELSSLEQVVAAFAPDVIVFAGWAVPRYCSFMKTQKGRALRVMMMDNPWRATPKQLLGVAVSPVYLQPLADLVFVPGERQARFARALGFRQSQLLYGSLTCDHTSFAQAAETHSGSRQPAFLYVGRFVAEKGLDTLVEAYKRYRQASVQPWDLHCCGGGPMLDLLTGQPGIVVRGFLQPSALPEVFARVSCFVLPSKNEPWGLVLHEAATAGLIIIATETAGAVPHLVRPGLNGVLVERSDVKQLADAMQRVECLSVVERSRMSAASQALAMQFTPQLWAHTLLGAAQTHRAVVLERSELVTNG